MFEESSEESFIESVEDEYKIAGPINIRRKSAEAPHVGSGR